MTAFRTIIPVSLFKKNTHQYLNLLDSSEREILLTVYGRGAFVLTHLNSYMELNRLANLAEHMGAVEEMLQGGGESAVILRENARGRG